MERVTSPKPGELSEEDAVAAFSASDVAMVLTNPRIEDNPIIYVNRAFERLTGYSSHSAMGRNCRFLQGEETDPSTVSQIRDAVKAGKDIAATIVNYRADRTPFHNALIISPVRDESDGEITLFLGLQTEVDGTAAEAERKHFEEMVAEIQHRVKNHLAMIVGLIRLHARQSSDGRGFRAISRRVESLQLLYEEMTSSGRRSNTGKIQLGAYLGRVANAIAHLDGRAGVRMNIDVAPLEVETDAAVRIGLLVSEVLTNAMQHAFEDQVSGLVELRVTATDGGGIRAMITDDGVGLPKDVDWPKEGSLGSRIVTGLCEGLGATLNVARGAVGTIITLDVPRAR